MQITREMWDQLSDEDKWFAIYSCQLALECQKQDTDQRDGYIKYLHESIESHRKNLTNIISDMKAT